MTLLALGISVPKMDAPPAPDIHASASSDVPAGSLFAIYCNNCTFPNMVPSSAVPMLMGIPLPCSRLGGQLGPATARLFNQRKLPLPPLPLSPLLLLFLVHLSQPASLTAVGPDGPWYVISKGQSAGVFWGWQNISNLVTGVRRACFFHHGTHATAEAAFNEALAAGAVEIL
ncbi:hypothetical protein ARMSODRAFT_1015286 [Armillaria solidipes]|uniref:Ribonuclease H1 N-terminal domain-containing protein n=1 Tax=Armillaria solidipes TaxID=1076256 RepID=A0A2H3BVW1_9AGAR|nr:hypothetical protein ARMSODRAFT_1015286 [Armillaria solidipes]